MSKCGKCWPASLQDPCCHMEWAELVLIVWCQECNVPIGSGFLGFIHSLYRSPASLRQSFCVGNHLDTRLACPIDWQGAFFLYGSLSVPWWTFFPSL